MQGRLVMKLVLGFAVPFAFCLVLLVAAPERNTPKPHHDAKGNLLRPADYRDWEFLSAGYGMNYSPAPGGHVYGVLANVRGIAPEDRGVGSFNAGLRNQDPGEATG